MEFVNSKIVVQYFEVLTTWEIAARSNQATKGWVEINLEVIKVSVHNYPQFHNYYYIRYTIFIKKWH